jgi:hypothetical protein
MSALGHKQPVSIISGERLVSGVKRTFNSSSEHAPLRYKRRFPSTLTTSLPAR